MKIAAVGLVLAAVVLSIGSGSLAASRVSVEATVEETRVGDFGDPGPTVGDVRSEFLLVWSGRDRPIGHGFVFCQWIGEGGLLGGGVQTCSLDLHMPLGKILAAGVRHSARLYSFPLTGGSGLYSGASGSVTVGRILPGRLSIIVRLR